MDADDRWQDALVGALGWVLALACSVAFWLFAAWLLVQLVGGK